MDADAALKVLVDLGVIGTDKVDAAREALNGLKDSTDKASASGDKFEKRAKANAEGLSSLNNETGGLSSKTKSYIEKLEEGSKSGEKFNLTHHEMHMLFRQLGPEASELSHVLQFLGSNVYLGLAFAIALVVGKMVEYNKEIKQMVETPVPELEKMTQQLEAVAKAYRDGTVELSTFERELNRISAKQLHTQEEVTNMVIEEKKRESTTQLQILSDTLARQKDLIDADEKDGITTHLNAILQKLAADVQYEKDKLEIAKHGRLEEMKAKEEEVKAIDKHQKDLQERLGTSAAAGGTGLKAQEDRTKAAQTRNSEILERNKRQLEKELDYKKNTEEQLSKLQEMASHPDMGSVALEYLRTQGLNVQSPSAGAAQLEDRLKNETGKVFKLRASIKQQEEAQGKLDDEANKAKENADEVREDLKAGREEERNAKRDIDKAKRQEPGLEKSEAEQAASRTLAEIEKQPLFGPFTGSQTEAASVAQASLDAGRGINTEQQKLLQAFRQFAAQHTNNTGDLIAAMHELGANQATQATQVKGILDILRLIRHNTGQ